MAKSCSRHKDDDRVDEKNIALSLSKFAASPMSQQPPGSDQLSARLPLVNSCIRRCMINRQSTEMTRESFFETTGVPG